MKSKSRIEQLVPVPLLKAFVSYDPISGLFYWKIRVAKRCVVGGETAQSVNSDGYKHLRINGCTIKAHRAAWAYTTNEWPADQIDHINGIRSDNRFCNLRLAAKAENLWNSSTRRKGKTSPAPKGVTFNKSKGLWVARIQKHKKSYFLGAFVDVESATKAYSMAAKLHFKEYARSE